MISLPVRRVPYCWFVSLASFTAKLSLEGGAVPHSGNEIPTHVCWELGGEGGGAGEPQPVTARMWASMSVFFFKF